MSTEYDIFQLSYKEEPWGSEIWDWVDVRTAANGPEVVIGWYSAAQWKQLEALLCAFQHISVMQIHQYSDEGYQTVDESHLLHHLIDSTDTYLRKSYVTNIQSI